MNDIDNQLNLARFHSSWTDSQSYLIVVVMLKEKRPTEVGLSSKRKTTVLDRRVGEAGECFSPRKCGRPPAPPTSVF